MARVSGPLFSFDASGTVAGAVVFSKWRGRPYVRRHAIPSNPMAPKQVAVRTMFAFLSREWQGLDPATVQDTWTDPATAKNFSKFNAYVAANMTSWKHGEYPSQVYPRLPAISPYTPTTPVAVGGVGLITVTITPPATPPTWGYAIHLSLTPGFTPSRITLVGIQRYDVSPHVIVIAPVVPDDWYVGLVDFEEDGASADGGIDGPITVT